MSAVAEAAGPFKFLDYYEESDRESFAGRNAEIDELLARLSRGRTLVFYGRSGLGKTSLLLAGLSPRLRERGYLPVYVRTLADPRTDLREALRGSLSTVGVPWNGSDDPVAVAQALGEKTAFVLVLDQFEEFFIRFRDDPATREAFIDVLGAIVDDTGIPARVVISLREDYLAELDDFRRRLPRLFDNELRLRPLTPFGVRAAITEPLVIHGVQYTNRLVGAIVDLLSEFDYDSVTLQIVCSEVYRRATATASGGALELTERDLEQVGGIDGIFRRYLADISTRLGSPESRLVARMVLDALITRESTKRALRATELAEGGFIASEQEVAEILEVLAAQRLVRTEPRGQETWYELSHERLVPIILEWLRSDPDYINLIAARDLVTSSSRNPAWRVQPETLLNEGQHDGVVWPYRARLRLEGEELEFVLWSSIFRRVEGVDYWLERAGVQQASKLLRSLLDHESPGLRAGALSALARRDPDQNTRARIFDLALKDEDENVRRTAGRALTAVAGDIEWKDLGRLATDPRMRPAVLEVLADASPHAIRGSRFGAVARWRAHRLRLRRAARAHRGAIADRTSATLAGTLQAWGLWALVVSLPAHLVFAATTAGGGDESRLGPAIVSWVFTGLAVGLLSVPVIWPVTRMLAIRETIGERPNVAFTTFGSAGWLTITAVFWLAVAVLASGSDDGDVWTVGLVCVVPWAFLPICVWTGEGALRGASTRRAAFAVALLAAWAPFALAIVLAAVVGEDDEDFGLAALFAGTIVSGCAAATTGGIGVGRLGGGTTEGSVWWRRGLLLAGALAFPVAFVALYGLDSVVAVGEETIRGGRGRIDIRSEPGYLDTDRVELVFEGGEAMATFEPMGLDALCIAGHCAGVSTFEEQLILPVTHGTRGTLLTLPERRGGRGRVDVRVEPLQRGGEVIIEDDHEPGSRVYALIDWQPDAEACDAEGPCWIGRLDVRAPLRPTAQVITPISASTHCEYEIRQGGVPLPAAGFPPRKLCYGPFAADDWERWAERKYSEVLELESNEAWDRFTLELTVYDALGIPRPFEDSVTQSLVVITP